MSERYNYWQDCIETSFGDHGIQATREQIAAVAQDVEGWHDNIGLAFHQPPNPLVAEIEGLRRELAAERSKVRCKECDGKGELVCLGPYHLSISQCPKCGGEGRRAP